MTYCLGVRVEKGLVFAADSRTNAGVDYISSYQKLFDFSVPGDRVIVLCTAGSLSTSQAVLHSIHQDIDSATEGVDSLYSLPSLHDVASYIGQKLRTIQDKERTWLEKDGIDYQSTFIVGGQVAGEEPGIYLVYSQGNFIEATPETPFLQIGETKYGKPILDRTISYESSLERAAKTALLSLDSTMRSNISVGPPIDMVLYETDALEIRNRVRLQDDDPYLDKIREYWERALAEASSHLPEIAWNRVEIQED
ncbi:proteasome-type protease [cf. Phormidesmis sp. LEGE 11477]|uniref:proteasome-type protease n=1 Tax=cf. Phormidesmis sp. LEGE 11477 TaxID=1828680 RepID=UPI0018815FA3|nr:proteasome-type protease [cf. Phormidesmis sp. LEGE 11477]MBE9061917.1 proteasome-type protease [cf. Phormidesmis sp. LEGE 11477]